MNFLVILIMAFVFMFMQQKAEAEEKAEELAPIQVTESPPVDAASSFTYGSDELELVPFRRTGDVLNVVPGLTVIEHAGGGKANQYYLRGIDADHGTDIAFYQDGIPINNVTHAHGQGYTDLNFIIPELLEAVDVRKGPYSVRDGNFATAGAVDLRLKDRLEANQISFQAGNFNTYRGLLLGGTSGEHHGIYAGSEIYYSDGPFENPNRYLRYNLVTRGSFERGNWKGDFTGSAYMGYWNASNQLPLWYVESGAISRLGAIDPSDGGNSHRLQASAHLEWKPSAQQKLDLLAYFYHYDLNLYSNFTFFLNDPVNGDQIEQKDDRQVAGLQAAYDRNDDWGRVGFHTQAGLGFRFDHISNQLNNTFQRQFLSPTTSNRVNELNPYFYAQEEIVPNEWFRLLLGFRGDVLYYNVRDLLAGVDQGNQAAFVPQPKASAIFTPLKELEIYLNFGQGFHSNDARGVLEPVDPASPYARATGAELGIHAQPFEKLKLDLAAWYLGLTSELVWVGDEGTTEPNGATVRGGLEAEARYDFADWIWAEADFTYTHARFKNLPAGQDYVPLAPTWTASAALNAKHPSGFYGSLRMEAISSRPANEDNSLTATGYMVWDLMAGYRKEGYDWFGPGRGGFDLNLQIQNLFNANYRESQFDTTSRPTPTGPVVDDVHFTPGYPFTVMGQASLLF